MTAKLSDTDPIPADQEVFFPLLLEGLARGKRVSFTPSGRSMLPTLRNGKDSVVLVPVTEPLKRLDLILYRRPQNTFVLHRIVGFCPNGDFILCGDSQTSRERVKPEQVLAVAESFIRKNRPIDCRKSLSYRIYSEIWVRSRLFRAVLAGGKRRLKRILRLFSRKKP